MAVKENFPGIGKIKFEGKESKEGHFVRTDVPREFL